MSDKSTRCWRWCAACVVALCVVSIRATGQGAEGIDVPLYVGNVVPLKDELGRPMRGSPAAAAAAARPRVEIRVLTNSYPLVNPDSFGGMGMNAAQADSGLFSMVLAKRPAAGTKIFARVYNAPTPEEATFFAQSIPVMVEENDNGITFVFSSNAMQPLDDGDDDGDGLNNSWEALLGIDDRATSDYDGDGMSDYAEMLAGTAPDDPDSRLEFTLVRPDVGLQAPGEGEPAPRSVRVSWQSVPGKRYQIQYVRALANATGDPVDFVTVAPTNFVTVPVLDNPDGIVTAGADQYRMDLWVDVGDRFTGTFRVRLVTTE